MSTLSELLTKLNTEYIKIDPNNKIWSIAEKTSFINDGFLQIQKDGGFKWRENQAYVSQATTAGVREYALPTDFIKLDMASYSGIRLSKTVKERVRLTNATGSQGTPGYYYIYGSYIGFDPIPNTTINIDLDYFKRLPKITSSVDSSLPDDFDAAICAYAAYKAMNSVEKQKASIMFTDYQLELNTLLSSYIYDDINQTFGIARPIPQYRSDVIY